MSAPAKLKVQAMQGMRPSLEFRPIADLQIDDSYQRSIDTGPSQALVKRIAIRWDWGLCQPLIVAKREDGSLWVIDGQHRLASARLRGDIWDLPCVVVASRSADEEAKAFVALNRERRPLSKLDLFKAALAADDREASIIMDALTDAGLSVANTTNPDSWKPGQVSSIGGLEFVLKQHGEAVLGRSCKIMAAAFPDQIMRYFGTIYPGAAAAVAALPKPWDQFELALVAQVMGGGSQEQWRDDINRAKAEQPNLNMRAAAEVAVVAALSAARED